MSVDAGVLDGIRLYFLIVFIIEDPLNNFITQRITITQRFRHFFVSGFPVCSLKVLYEVAEVIDEKPRSSRAYGIDVALLPFKVLTKPRSDRALVIGLQGGHELPSLPFVRSGCERPL